MNPILYVTTCQKQPFTCTQSGITNHTSVLSLLSNLSNTVTNAVIVTDDWVPSYAQPSMEFPVSGRSAFIKHDNHDKRHDSYVQNNNITRHVAASVGKCLDSLRDNAVSSTNPSLYKIMNFLLERDCIHTSDVELVGIINDSRDNQNNGTKVSSMTQEADESRLEKTLGLLHIISNNSCSIKKQGPFSYLVDPKGYIIPGTCSISLEKCDNSDNNAFFESRFSQSASSVLKTWYKYEKVYGWNHPKTDITNAPKKIIHSLKKKTSINECESNNTDGSGVNRILNNCNTKMYKTCCSNIPYVVCVCLASQPTDAYENIRKRIQDAHIDKNHIKRYWVHGLLRSIFTAAKKVGTGRVYVAVFPGIDAKQTIRAVRKYTESAKNIKEVVIVAFDIDIYTDFLSNVTGSKKNSSFLHTTENPDTGPRKTIFGKSITHELDSQTNLFYEACTNTIQINS